MKKCIKCHCVFDGNDFVCKKCGHAPININGFSSFAPNLDGCDDFFDKDIYKRFIKLQKEFFWSVYRNRVISWAISKYADIFTNIFEIGCGTGFILSHLNTVFGDNTKFFGSEINSSALKVATEVLPQAEYYQMDIRNIPFKEEFNVVGAFDVIEHVKEDAEALSEMNNALVDSGILVLTVPQHKWLWSKMDEANHHKRRYERTELVRLMQSSGFDILLCTSLGFFLLPLLYLSRIIQNVKTKDKDIDILAELNISPVLNKILSYVCNFELFLLRKGIHFHVGGTLLCIAKKRNGL